MEVVHIPHKYKKILFLPCFIPLMHLLIGSALCSTAPHFQFRRLSQELLRIEEEKEHRNNLDTALMYGCSVRPPLRKPTPCRKLSQKKKCPSILFQETWPTFQLVQLQPATPTRISSGNLWRPSGASLSEVKIRIPRGRNRTTLIHPIKRRMLIKGQDRKQNSLSPRMGVICYGVGMNKEGPVEVASLAWTCYFKDWKGKWMEHQYEALPSVE